MLSQTSAHATVYTFGPFRVDSTSPDAINLDGEIDAGAALNFRRALAAAPAAKLVVLNSPGGLVAIALLIADDVHQHKLSTYIPGGSECLSACSFVFFAGAERKVDGALGVHQISMDSGDISGAQVTIADIIDVLNGFETLVEVLTIMFRRLHRQCTSSRKKKFFATGSIGRSLGRLLPRVETSGLRPPEVTKHCRPNSIALSRQQRLPGLMFPQRIHPLRRPRPRPSLPSRPTPKRPTRMAIYVGLDLFGADVTSSRVGDAPACARSCLSMGGQCKAFTFNVELKARGPNCFLKASEGRADGNAVAISGKLLSGIDPDPAPFTMGVIDPQLALYRNVDLPGGDLSHGPHGKGSTLQECRLACVARAQCLAFTYVKLKSECWLQGSIVRPRHQEGMVTGLKKTVTFSPATIISLE